MNIWELIEGLKKDEVMSRQLTLSQHTGASFPSSSQQVREKQKRMTNLLTRYQEGKLGLLQLIQGISRNLSYVNV